MMKKIILALVVSLFLIAYLPLSAIAMMDLDADPTPVVSSGSFICKTWGGTTMDTFSIEGGTLSDASFSRSQGLVVYNLIGSSKVGEAISLNISGSQWDMSNAMVGLKHNQIMMSVRYLDAGGNDITEPVEYSSGESKSPSLSGSISGTVPAGSVQAVIQGTFTCTWSSANSTASETVGVYAEYSVNSGAVTPAPVETTQPASQTPSPTPVPGEKKIVLSGQIRDVENKPMRRMKLEIAAFFDSEDGMMGGSSPDWKYSGASDVKGYYKVEIPVPAGQEKPVQIMIQGDMRCLLPGNSETYKFVDMSEPAANEAILLASWFSIDTSGDEYAETDIIPVNRVLSFRYLEAGAWSFAGDGAADIFQTNLTDLKKLATYSYTYSMVWNAQYVGGYMFKEIDKIKQYPLTIEMCWSPSASAKAQISHFDIPERTIRLVEDNCGYNDYARYVILHEYGHFLDAMTNDGWYRTTYDKPAVKYNINHAGYMNSDTSDSYIEAFATSYAAIVQTAAKNKNPQMAGAFDLGQAGNYIAWGANGTDEELAIAVLLYQMSLKFESPLEYWQIVKRDFTDFYQYYKEFEDTLSGSEQSLGQLRQAAIAGGLYQMPFGSSRYEFGEPYLDLNGNGIFDNSDPFADLMYELDDSGQADFENPMKKFEISDLVSGKSADNNRRERQTTYLQPNSFIYLSGEPIENLLVTIRPDNGQIVKMLMPVVNDEYGPKVYAGLLHREQNGELEISVPGGQIIFRSDLKELFERFSQTVGQTVPLAEANITGADLAPAGTRTAPTGGDPSSEGIMPALDLSNISEINDEAARLAKDTDPEAGPEADGLDWPDSQTNTDDLPEAENRSNSWLILILIIAVFLLAIIAVVIVLIVAKRKKAVFKTQPANSPYQIQELMFCPDCGARYEFGSQFCVSCGKPRPPV